jgi:two-component system, NarL family, sensor histidine kinase DevS
VSQQPTPHQAALLDAVAAVGDERDLTSALRRIVSAAVDLVGARYGALGVVAPDGHGLCELVHVGMDEATAESIGALPTLRGVLGVVLDEPIRLPDVTAHPRATGFPSNHPPMTSFLGVPIRIRDTMFGNLYLTEKRSGGEFTAEDERVVRALATSAGIVMENTRLYERSRQRERWLRAASEVTRLLLAGAEGAEVFTRIAEHVRQLTDATDAAVLLPTPHGMLQVVAGVGDASSTAIGMDIDPATSLSGTVFRGGAALMLTDVEMIAYQRDKPEQPAVGPTLVVPLSAAGHTRGVLTASRRRGDAPFTEEALDTMRAFAEQAELACELAERRRDSEALSLFADRDRIARNLHDLVIQRLFATGMVLEGAASLVGVDPADARGRIQRAVGDLDTTIKEIRTTVFALQTPDDLPLSVRARILEVIDGTTMTLGFPPSVRFEGPVDTVVGEHIAEQLLAVLREALSNVVRHAAATAVEVTVSARDRLVMQVRDNGAGMPATPAAAGRRGGLANMASRATQLGGELSVEDAQPGTVLCWTVPLG